jgi:predicted nucleotidyltransferase
MRLGPLLDIPVSKPLSFSVAATCGRDGAVERSLLTDAEREALGELRARLEQAIGPDLVRCVLYGSRARGDCLEGSDIDIAIVVRELTREQKHRILDLVADIELSYMIPLSTLVFSLQEFERLAQRERRIALDIEREGIPLERVSQEEKGPAR